jgi:hypothetical protein
MRRRFILALILAILPFAVLAAGQAAWRLIRAESQAREDLIDAARASSAVETNVVVRAEAVLRALGKSAGCPRRWAGMQPDPGQCPRWDALRRHCASGSERAHRLFVGAHSR